MQEGAEAAVAKYLSVLVALGTLAEVLESTILAEPGLDLRVDVQVDFLLVQLSLTILKEGPKLLQAIQRT